MPKFKDTTKGEGGVSLQLTPMIDIIFQLLIFFMIGMQFRIPDNKIDTFLPAEGPPEQQDTLTENYDIAILPKGQFGARFYIGRIEFASARAMASTLKGIADRGSDYNIVVKPESGVAFKNVMDVLDLCVWAGLDKISFGQPAGP